MQAQLLRAIVEQLDLLQRSVGILSPPASARLSFALYNTPGDVTHAMDAVRRVADRLRRGGRRPVRRPAT